MLLSTYPPGVRPQLALHQRLRRHGQLLPAAVRAPQLQEEGPVPVGNVPGDVREEARPGRAEQERVHAQDGDAAAEGVQLLRHRHHRDAGGHGREVFVRRGQRRSQVHSHIHVQLDARLQIPSLK